VYQCPASGELPALRGFLLEATMAYDDEATNFLVFMLLLVFMFIAGAGVVCLLGTNDTQKHGAYVLPCDDGYCVWLYGRVKDLRFTDKSTTLDAAKAKADAINHILYEGVK
jgi:hypothetical protein